MGRGNRLRRGVRRGRRLRGRLDHARQHQALHGEPGVVDDQPRRRAVEVDRTAGRIGVDDAGDLFLHEQRREQRLAADRLAEFGHRERPADLGVDRAPLLEDRGERRLFPRKDDAAQTGGDGRVVLEADPLPPLELGAARHEHGGARAEARDGAHQRPQHGRLRDGAADLGQRLGQRLRGFGGGRGEPDRFERGADIAGGALGDLPDQLRVQTLRHRIPSRPPGVGGTSILVSDRRNGQ